jgi:hypothetical protein
MIRVLLADDQVLVRAGFRVLLDAEPDIAFASETPPPPMPPSSSRPSCSPMSS